MCISPTSSSWVLYSERWAGACSPDREPAHNCHSGPQGLDASDLYKVAELITPQAASRALFPPVLECGLFPGAPEQDTVSVCLQVVICPFFLWALLLWAVQHSLHLPCVRVGGPVDALGPSRASLPASRNLCLEAVSVRAVTREPPATGRDSIGEMLRGPEGSFPPCSCGKGTAVVTWDMAVASLMAHSERGAHWCQQQSIILDRFGYQDGVPSQVNGQGSSQRILYCAKGLGVTRRSRLCPKDTLSFLVLGSGRDDGDRDCANPSGLFLVTGSQDPLPCLSSPTVISSTLFSLLGPGFRSLRLFGSSTAMLPVLTQFLLCPNPVTEPSASQADCCRWMAQAQHV